MNHPTNFGDEFVVKGTGSRDRVFVRSSVMFRRLKDEDAMPFGRFRGTPMKDVPADYLEPLIDAPWLSQWPAVKEYIERNLSVLQAECDKAESSRGW